MVTTVAGWPAVRRTDGSGYPRVSTLHRRGGGQQCNIFVATLTTTPSGKSPAACDNVAGLRHRHHNGTGSTRVFFLLLSHVGGSGWQNNLSGGCRSTTPSEKSLRGRGDDGGGLPAFGTTDGTGSAAALQCSDRPHGRKCGTVFVADTFIARCRINRSAWGHSGGLGAAPERQRHRRGARFNQPLTGGVERTNVLCRGPPESHHPQSHRRRGVTTLAGNPGVPESPMPGSSARFNSPSAWRWMPPQTCSGGQFQPPHPQISQRGPGGRRGGTIAAPAGDEFCFADGVNQAATKFAASHDAKNQARRQNPYLCRAADGSRHVVTRAALEILRMRWLKLSATNTLVAASTPTPMGELKRAELPGPLVTPGTPGVPASVVTTRRR